MNSGINATRGYLFQYLICVIDSFQYQSNWSSVIIEPNTDQEKVDILWLFETDSGEYKKAVQVKSTKNYFNEKEVIRLADELKNKYNNANEYELILVGNFLSTLGKYLRENKNQHKEVKIPNPKTFDLEFFIGHACHKIDRYLEEKYATQLPWRQRENLVFSLIGKLQHYSTSKREVTRKQFEADLQYWIESHTNITDYELRADDNFRRRYGFNAPPSLRIAIDNFYKQSRKVKRSFFKECRNFLYVDRNTRELKVVYRRTDKYLFYLGTCMQIIIFILMAVCIYLYIMVYTHAIFVILSIFLFLLLFMSSPFVRPYCLARIIENEIKEIYQ